MTIMLRARPPCAAMGRAEKGTRVGGEPNSARFVLAQQLVCRAALTLCCASTVHIQCKRAFAYMQNSV